MVTLPQRTAAGTVVALLALLLSITVPMRSAAAMDSLDELLVTGEQPGPGLWKVSNGDHVMWILGIHRPLPRAMSWNSSKVEERIAHSQQVLLPGLVRVESDIGKLRGLTLLPSMLRAAKNPDGATLDQILPAQAYAKWQVLKSKYLGRSSGIEAYRPTFAAARLQAEAIRKNGLGNSLDIEAVIRRAARKHKVAVEDAPSVKRLIHVESPRAALKRARRMEISDAECFDQTMERLESDIDAMRIAANAWATGDVEQMRASRAVARARSNCFDVWIEALEGGKVADATEMRDALAAAKRQSTDARRELNAKWLDAARSALSRNLSTFAVLPMEELLDPDGIAAQLRKLGFSVEEP